MFGLLLFKYTSSITKAYHLIISMTKKTKHFFLDEQPLFFTEPARGLCPVML